METTRWAIPRLSKEWLRILAVVLQMNMLGYKIGNIILILMANKPSLMRKAFSTEGQITKQEIFDILFVLKQIIGAILGVVIAFAGLTGTFALVVYAGSSYVLIYFYVMRVLQPEQDTVEAVDIFKEHWAMGFFAFLLTWILTHNILNY